MTIYRMKIIFPLLILFVARSALSIRITSEGLKRMSPCSKCQCSFSWKLDEPISNYKIFHLKTSSPKTQGTNYDISRGEITLHLESCGLSDAGNYSLVIAQGSNTFIDSTACLFIYGDLQGSLILSSGQEPATEGDTLEFTCNVTSSSFPAAYRPDIYYSWEIRGKWKQETISFGHVMFSDRMAIPGYSLKNNGSTLVVSSAQQQDQYIRCRGREDGGRDIYCSHSVKIGHVPIILHWYPSSKKYNVAYGKSVELILVWISHRETPTNTSWEFVNRNGVPQNLPPDSDCQLQQLNALDCTWLKFNFTSNEYYGKYSFDLTNDIGSTTVKFEVLPEGPPETPSNVVITDVAHNTIDIHWNVMWSNSLEHRQTVFCQLTLVENGTIAEYSSTSYDLDMYNQTYSHRFKNSIQPKTIYNVSVWSVNKFGSSEVVELQVRTREQPKLIAATMSTKETEQNKIEDEGLNSNACKDKYSLLIAVIALSILLGITSLVCLTAYLVRRFGTKREQLFSDDYLRMSDADAGSRPSLAVVFSESVEEHP